MGGAGRSKTVVLLSMGYDSLSTWHQLRRPVAVHFNLGTRYSQQEVTRYEKLRASFPQLLPVQNLRWLGQNEQADAWIPLRNLLMTVHAAALGFDDVVISAPADYAADKRLSFTLLTSLAMRAAQPGTPYRVRRPFSHWTKARLIEATQSRAARERLTGAATARMRESLDMETVLRTAIREIGEALNLHDATIQLTVDGNDRVQAREKEKRHDG